MGTTQQKDFFLKVSMGEVSGMSKVNKFGHNLAATSGEDVWGGGGTYGFYPTESVTMDIKSSSANDTSAGTGARTVQIYGLDSSWELQDETVTLNGTTEVALANEYVRLFRCVVLTAGTTGTNAGVITVQSSEAAGGIADNTVGIHIGIGDGQTQHAIYTTPANTTSYFLKGYVGVADDDKNGEVAVFQWLARPNTVANGAWAVKGEMGCNTLGAGHWQYEYGVPSGGLPGKTDIRIRVVDATATLGVVGGFDLIIVDD